jgi:hypothetical protein
LRCGTAPAGAGVVGWPGLQAASATTVIMVRGTALDARRSFTRNACSCSTRPTGERSRRRQEVAPANELPGEGDHHGRQAARPRLDASAPRSTPSTASVWHSDRKRRNADGSGSRPAGLPSWAVRLGFRSRASVDIGARRRVPNPATPQVRVPRPLAQFNAWACITAMRLDTSCSTCRSWVTKTTPYMIRCVRLLRDE